MAPTSSHKLSIDCCTCFHRWAQPHPHAFTGGPNPTHTGQVLSSPFFHRHHVKKTLQENKKQTKKINTKPKYPKYKYPPHKSRNEHLITEQSFFYSHSINCSAIQAITSITKSNSKVITNDIKLLRLILLKSQCLQTMPAR